MSWLKESCAWFDGLSPDLKLGGRMLVKYPGLTTVGGLAMAFAICVGAGIYAVLSFIVARRTREIGVRVALGASRQRVVGAIFRRPLSQVGLGILAGAALITAAGSVETEMPGLSGGLSLRDVAIILAYATLMLGVCLLACVVPTRRALGVEPTTALRMD